MTCTETSSGNFDLEARLSVLRVAMVVMLPRAVLGFLGFFRGRVDLEEVPVFGAKPVRPETEDAVASNLIKSRLLASLSLTNRFMISKFC